HPDAQWVRRGTSPRCRGWSFATRRSGGRCVTHTFRTVSVGRWLVLLLPVVVAGCAPPPPAADPAAWEQWVHTEVQQHAKDTGPAWQQPGVEAAVVQFGYDYRDRRDKKRLSDDGMDRKLVPELRAELV